MVSILFSEENVLLLQYLNRLQVTLREKSLNSPKVQKNSLNMKSLPGARCQVQNVCAGVCVCTVHMKIAVHDRAVHRNQSEVQGVSPA